MFETLSRYLTFNIAVLGKYRWRFMLNIPNLVSLNFLCKYAWKTQHSNFKILSRLFI